MKIPTHDEWRTEKDRAQASSVRAHFWVNDGSGPDLASESGAVLVGPDPDYGGIAFHVGDSITFTVDESDLLEAIARLIREP